MWSAIESGLSQSRCAELVLLAVQVLLVRLAGRRVLAQLVAGVQTPVRAHRGGEGGAHAERRRRAVAQRPAEDVGRVGPEVRAEVVGAVALGQLLAVLAQLPRRRAPREVRVALGEAERRQRVHHLRPRERLGEEQHVGMAAAHVVDHPLPERERLRVRVVDAEDAARRGRSSARGCRGTRATGRRGPRPSPARTRSDGCPGTSSAGSRRSGSSRRAAAGTTPDARGPTGGRGCTGARSRGRPPCRATRPPRGSATKSARVPSSGWMASWPPSAPPIAHGLPGSSGAGRQRVVAALAVGDADRMDGRQVDDVEAHLGDVAEALRRDRRSRPRSAGTARTRR